jgi:biopolymer transport protein ExbD
VLNLQYTPGLDEPLVRLGPFVIPSGDVLRDRLKSTKRANPKVQLVLRADREVPYRYVRSAMNVVAESEIELVNIGVQTDRD